MKRYKDKDYLYNQYWIKKKSAVDIGFDNNVDDDTIIYWMKKFNIPRRKKGEAGHLARTNHCQLNNKMVEWINGELLGDGGLYSQHPPYSALFGYGSKYMEYIQYVSDTLDSFGIEQSGKINTQINKWGVTYNYASLSYEELYPIRKKWYPNDKKIIPKDVELTPLTLRQWYIGDGNLKTHKKWSSQIRICSYNFLKSDVKRVIRGMNKLGFKTSLQLDNNRNTIYVSTKSVPDFIDYIGKCPVESYKYKWNY